MKHNPWLMILCCLGPLLLFIVAPAMGFNKVNALWVLIPVVLVVGFMMIGKGGKGGCCGGHQDKKPEIGKKEGEQKKQGCH